MENEGRVNASVRMVWVMRDAAESSWALSSPKQPSFKVEDSSDEDEDRQDEEPKAEKTDDDGIELYVTTPQTANSNFTSSESNSVEMHNITSIRNKPKTTYSRPDLRAIVDATFSQGLEERVAILICGPPGMAAELRTHVGKWVEKGRHVWWHDEGFGW
ncbi:hypothetical protein DID88_001767 [Monilinia fructigena]|uniref:Ferric reductase NAD binding domain-containing protein n=1 Tax=Monilinia fructigena TaxID=38457 RepID=A0A395IXL2_9HELO|nr:hypothetical protein DID88_001767 [Monilinia fructigena]